MGIQEPCLQHYLSPHLVASFMSFHIALKHCSSTIKQHVATSLKVLAWWSTKQGGHDIGLKEMREQWLPTLSSQVGLALPKPVKSARDLPAAKTLLTTIVQQRLAVMRAIQETGMTAALARTLHASYSIHVCLRMVQRQAGDSRSICHSFRTIVI